MGPNESWPLAIWAHAPTLQKAAIVIPYLRIIALNLPRTRPRTAPEYLIATFLLERAPGHGLPKRRGNGISPYRFHESGRLGAIVL